MRHQTETLTITRHQRAGRQLVAARGLLVGMLSILCWSATLAPAWGQAPIAHYRLDETTTPTVCAPSTVCDSAGTRHGTNNGATINQTGRIGTSYSLNGTTASISIPNGLATISGLNTHAITMWVNVQSVSNYPMLYDASAGGGYDFFLELGPAGGPTFYWGYGGSYRTYSGPPLSTGWHHIAAVKEGAGNMGTLYIDGVPLTPDTGTSFGSMPAATNLQLGKYKSNQYYLNGNIDDVKIYNVALAPSAVCAEALKTWNGSSCVAGTPTVATPTISPAAGSYTTSVTVTLATATAGAQLRYTTNNTAPTATSTLYSAPFALTSSATVRAIGILSGYNNSLEASAAYTITTGGTGSWQTSGSNIYYTTGNVGIGGVPSSTANLRLQVTGDVSVSGNIGAKYQDVAEWVPSPAPLPAGTVVILDMEHNNQVIASTHAYDTKVAGVISSMPGLLLGIEGEGKVKVATTGRVKVKVDASKGAIKVGDLLVTSDVPGVAMRSEATEINGRRFHQPGTIVGKALEPLAEGEGEILVLLSLQ